LSFDLERFEISDMLRCGRGAREAARGLDLMESAAEAMARFFYEEFRGADGERQCVLVRCYKTHPYGALEPEQRRFADRLLGARAAGDLPVTCLTLLATVGDEPAWCDRRRSMGHQAIPLVSVEMVEQAPMIAQLIRQFGLEIHQVLRPGGEILHARGGKSFNVFHVEEARGSPYIPAQADFVVKHGVRSVVGFGGALRSGELFATILFTRVPMGAVAAERFRNIALDVKYALFNYGDEQIFSSAPSSDARAGSPTQGEAR
jgi:hypothetical protein